uniref:DUF1553 domain-containing protein n=1 Tax=Schlesneria paludicola TaxID=360056 RepID=A0A7C4QQW2_9PLAN
MVEVVATGNNLTEPSLRIAPVKWTLCCLVVSASAAFAADIAVFPHDVRLIGPEARQRIIVQAVQGASIGRQLHAGVQFQSADERVATIEDGMVVPKGNGQTTIRVIAGERGADVPVVVERFDQPHIWNFRNQVQSVLTKAGCNMGACHGAAAGKNGFKLSLRGYDPEGDYFALTRQARGRRIVPHDPGRSLILTKPTGLIPHKGGLRFEEESLEYRVLAEWLAQGQPAPSADDPRISRLELLPPHVNLAAGDQQQFLVRAHFTDGHVEDVTRWAKYSSTNHSVAQIDDHGRVEVAGSGEAAIVAWYLALNVTATVSVPFPHQVADDVFAAAASRNLIDRLILEKLRALRMPPSPRCSDAEFLRRASLDTIGLLPTPEAVRAFLADADPLKREKLVDDLLSRPEFVDYWTYFWSDLFLLSGERLRPQALKTFSQWIRDRVAENAPWDQIARGILLAQGSTFENGAANFYALHQDPQDMAETVSMAFLGMSINCARCHDHPLEKWTNDDYYGMVSLFARVRGKGWGGDYRNGDGNRTIFVAERGEVIQPRTGKPQRPRPLDGAPLDFDAPGDRREALALWLTSKDNPYFSKAIVNRIWANFFGIGLVDKVDDLRLTNPPSHPELFQRLADDLADNGYNLKTLMRQILTSETYQRSAQVLPENADDQRFFARFYPRRLSAEVLLDAVSQVTGVPTAFKDFPPGTRALQLPDSSVASYFLEAFGRPDRLITCTCERSDAPSMTQVLHLTNGTTLLEKLEAPDGRIAQLAASDWPAERIVDELYLAALSRFPTAEERAQLAQVLAEAPAAERRAVIEDLCWSILTSREFLFQH